MLPGNLSEVLTLYLLLKDVHGMKNHNLFSQVICISLNSVRTGDTGSRECSLVFSVSKNYLGCLSGVWANVFVGNICNKYPKHS